MRSNHPVQRTVGQLRYPPAADLRRYTVRNACLIFLAAGTLPALAAPADVCADAYRASNAVAEAQCQKLAASGDADAQFGYGLVLFSGHGRKSQQGQESLTWLRLAAKQGHLMARVMLGRVLSDGEMLPPELRNPVEGYAWWAIAGERDAALGLSTKLSAEQLAQAQKMATEFQSKYGASK